MFGISKVWKKPEDFGFMGGDVLLIGEWSWFCWLGGLAVLLLFFGRVVNCLLWQFNLLRGPYKIRKEANDSFVLIPCWVGGWIEVLHIVQNSDREGSDYTGLSFFVFWFFRSEVFKTSKPSGEKTTCRCN